MGSQRYPNRTRWTRIGLTCVILTASAAGHANAITDRPRSYVELKYALTVRQERDFTCGAAALATILKYHYGMPVTEGMLFWMIVKRYTPEQLKQKAEAGLSFEDLIFVAEKLGFRTQAAVIEMGELEKLKGPVIVLIDKNKFDHFVVLRKKTKDVAYLSDPVFGALSLDNKDFAKEFKGPVLAIWPSYIEGDYFSGLSVIRDPISVERALNHTLSGPATFFMMPK